VRSQQLALARCQALGIDPDQAAGLNKVTLSLNRPQAAPS
jgi:hypothetical protein